MITDSIEIYEISIAKGLPEHEASMIGMIFKSFKKARGCEKVYRKKALMKFNDLVSRGKISRERECDFEEIYNDWALEA